MDDFDFSIDDRIEGLKQVLVEADQERAKQRINFISSEDKENVISSNANVSEIGKQWSWKLFGPEIEKKKQEALEQLESLSAELENSYHSIKNKNTNTQEAQDKKDVKIREYVVPDIYMLLVFLSLLLYIMYVFIGLGKAHVKVFD
jgi:hypothetical protein